jgi:hypothetical protein
VIKSAFNSTGLDSYLPENSELLGDLSKADSDALQFEVTVATKEIQWRLRDIARNLALQSVALGAGEADSFQLLITQLDGGH